MNGSSLVSALRMASESEIVATEIERVKLSEITPVLGYRRPVWRSGATSSMRSDDIAPIERARRAGLCKSVRVCVPQA